MSVNDIRESRLFKPGTGAYDYCVNTPCAKVFSDRINNLKTQHDIESIVFTMRIALFNPDYINNCNKMLLIHVLQIIEYFGIDLIRKNLKSIYNIELEGIINEAS